jgi:hypothetical protein
MLNYRFEGSNPEHSIDEWIREHGVASAEARVREVLLEAMDAEDVGQLTISASAGALPDAFDVVIEGPRDLARKARAALRKC